MVLGTCNIMIMGGFRCCVLRRAFRPLTYSQIQAKNIDLPRTTCRQLSSSISHVYTHIDTRVHHVSGYESSPIASNQGEIITVSVMLSISMHSNCRER